MTSDPILRRVHAAALALVPVMLWSPPGAGKTARVRSYGKVAKMHVERWLLSRCEPIDIKPRTYHEGHVVVTDAPEMTRLINMAANSLSILSTAGVWALLFADELNLATRETEGAMLDKIDSPPDGVAVIAAGNPPSRGMGSRSLGAAAANRFCHLDVTPDPKGWCNAQINGWPENADDFPLPDPKKLEVATGKIRMLASAFISRRPALLQACPDTIVEAGKAWPSERSWEMAIKVYAMAMALGLDKEDSMALIAGCVGPGPMVEFETYCLDASLVDPELWLAKPKGYAPDRVDQAVAATSAVAHAIKSNLDDARWRQAWKITEHLSEATLLDGQPLIDAAMVLGDMLTAIWHHERDTGNPLKITNPATGLMPVRMAKVMV
jgi:hypothetical protein